VNVNCITDNKSDDDNYYDSGLASLMMLLRFHDVSVDPAHIIHEFMQGDSTLNAENIVLVARHLKMMAKLVWAKKNRLEFLPYPVIAEMSNGEFSVLARWSDEGLLIHDSASGKLLRISLAEYENVFSGIFISSKASMLGDIAKFDFTWFIPSIVKYRIELIETLLVSLLLQLLALVTPLFFQVITDKVLVNNAANTLQVLSIGLLLAYLFENILSGLRSYVFSHTTNRIDVELGAKLFKHLLALPISYFKSRRVGDSVARVRELENIRSFITGNAVTVVLDLLFSIIFIAIMFFYNIKLALVVVVSLPVYIFISIIYTPVLRVRLEDKFNKGAENQSFLVESIAGAETIKSSAVEPQWQKNWNQQLTAYVHASFRVMTTSLLAKTWVSIVGRIVTVAIMWIGALEVINGTMTIGELIAFNMFAQHVAEPVLRLSQLWNDFQQVGISMQRLGDILNTPTENTSSQIVLPKIVGKIEISNLSFRYNIDNPDVLRNVDLTIEPGSIIGIVGRSGSGKSTLTKLIQRLQTPRSGRILIDDVDLSTVDSASLRRQIGVVLQENVLFSRSIRDNIALSNPLASIDSIVSAAKLAGAHDFISELQAGYNTLVGENGSTLSGGQRQRIAIARALLNQPRILIFDEATSALDYESENAIQKNMSDICKDKTVIIIAHRLSAVRKADKIIVFEAGEIVEMGSYVDLSLKKNGFFARLLSLQNSDES
jgi:subfamily B ATP-binding cassette protein HlyB/CyaB